MVMRESQDERVKHYMRDNMQYLLTDIMGGKLGTRYLAEDVLMFIRDGVGSRSSDSFLSRSEGLVHAEGVPTRFMAASGGVLSEGYKAWRAWLPGRWPDEGRSSTVARWTRRRAAPTYVPISDLTCHSRKRGVQVRGWVLFPKKYLSLT